MASLANLAKLAAISAGATIGIIILGEAINIALAIGANRLDRKWG